MNYEPFGNYTLKDAKADSKKAITAWRERALAKIVAWNAKRGIHVPHMFFAVAATLPVLIATAHA